MRVLLADDHHLVRDALAAYIVRSDPAVEVLTADSFDAAHADIAAGAAVDIVVLDLNMPGMNGLGGIERLAADFPGLPVVLMSGSASRADVEGALRAGARGYLPKTLKGAAFVSALRIVLAGEVFLPAGGTDAGEAAAAERSAADMPPFTRRERDVLAGHVQGWSNKEIARSLDLQEVTVKLHVQGICRKLSARNRTEAALRAVQLGWKA